MPVVRISERLAYIPGAVNIGVVIGDSGRCAMIDTGLNDTSAKKALKAIAAEIGLPVSLVLTTHAHADHFGGNATVVKRTGAEVWAPPLDEAILRNPLLQPSLLFGGADPPASLRGGFLLAESSPVDRVLTKATADFDGVPMDVIPLPGHSPGQVGYLIDGTFFCADIVLPDTVLDKYKIPYLYSVADHLRSLDFALTIDCRQVVPGHGEVDVSIEPAVNSNRSLVHQVADCVLHLAGGPQSAESLLIGVLERFDAPIADPGSYFLLQPTIYAFLSHLEGTGAIASQIDGKQLLWERV